MCSVFNMWGEQPYHIELLSSYEACVSYREGVVIAVVAGRLMNAATWNDIPLVVSCTLVPRMRMNAIVKAHENIRDMWNGDEHKMSCQREKYLLNILLLN